jgi:molybdopterin molybdotransferase
LSDLPEPSPGRGQGRGAAPGDVRMRGFQRRFTVAETLRWLDEHVISLEPESIPLARSSGRVLAADVRSRFSVPQFARAMMDGYALQAGDTLGASPYHRLPLQVIGQALPGAAFSGRVQTGQAVRIMTGAPLPEGADAVLPVERVEQEEGQIQALDAVPPGKHVGRIGEDIAADSTVFHSGRRLRPQDLGVLSSIGEGQVQVVRQPRVRIVVTGNELLPPGSSPTGHKIVDANSPMLVALVERDGGLVKHPGLVPDEPARILEALRDDADVILVSGGSSVGQEDHAPRLLAAHGQLAIHGIAMRPSSPAGMGRLDGRLVFLLPGNPVSCLCAYDFFAGRAIRALGGRPADWPYARCRHPLRRKLVSVVGRVDYARVQIIDNQVEPLAIGGASVLSSTCRADGFVVIPEDSEGYPPGTEVDVHLYL